MVSGNNKVDSFNERIAKIIEEYDTQGLHRTGTDIDLINAHWLSKEITRIGLKPFLYGFYIPQIEVQEAKVQFGHEKINGIPSFDSNLIENVSNVEKIDASDNNSSIGLIKSPTSGDKHFIKYRQKSKHLVIIVATIGRTPGLTPINADYFEVPFGPPVLYVPSDAWPRLLEASNSKENVKVTIKTKKVESVGFNVLTRISGKDSSLPPLIVMTPRSGWWHCASERGGGIACFLEMMRALKYNKPERDVLFMANTGHEIGDLGFQNFISNHMSLIKNSHYWIHLGANFAASFQPQKGQTKPPLIIVQASNSEIKSITLDELSNVGIKVDMEKPIGTRSLGAAKVLFDLGASYISILGSNDLYHHPEDRWPDAIDLNKTAKIIEAFTNLGFKLAN